jgi:hypothetical protein
VSQGLSYKIYTPSAFTKQPCSTVEGRQALSCDLLSFDLHDQSSCMSLLFHQLAQRQGTLSATALPMLSKGQCSGTENMKISESVDPSPQV